MSLLSLASITAPRLLPCHLPPRNHPALPTLQATLAMSRCAGRRCLSVSVVFHSFSIRRLHRDRVLQAGINLPLVTQKLREKLMDVTKFVDFVELLRPSDQIATSSKIKQYLDNLGAVLSVHSVRFELISSYAWWKQPSTFLQRTVATITPCCASLF